MGRYARKKQHKGDKPLKAKYRTRRRTKDHDQIHDDLKPENCTKLTTQNVDYDVTGGAQFYCLHCARYFVSNDVLKKHFSSKPHKQRIRALRIEPYSQAEADRAAGMGSYVAPKKVDIKTQDVKDDNMDIIEQKIK